MARWYRTLAFSGDYQPLRVERWEYRSRDGRTRAFEVEVQAGKALDVLSLKGTDLEEVRAYNKLLQRTAVELYGPSSNCTDQRQCPACFAGLEKAMTELHVFGVPYVRCPECGHVAVGRRPDPAALNRVFAESEEHSSAYVDRAALETRMKQIIAPKIDWCVEHYRRRRGRAPAQVIDVGAGGGHFLAGAQRHGMKVEGFEKSRASRAFAKEAFALELRADDFDSAKLDPADLVTFWGLLEYLQEPRKFLAAARRAVAPEGMLVVEVPRADALGTRVQAAEGAIIARHMDPTTHVNAFSDESLCTALVGEGFAPVAAWYFGMDAYEAFMQAALHADDANLLPGASSLIPLLQQSLDLGRRCDDIVIAAVPLQE
jgi:2-polyprenyl-3-methyl-5-hydroxy-6-metoxy-1,4-benzoquinol methylase